MKVMKVSKNELVKVLELLDVNTIDKFDLSEREGKIDTMKNGDVWESDDAEQWYGIKLIDCFDSYIYMFCDYGTNFHFTFHFEGDETYDSVATKILNMSNFNVYDSMALEVNEDIEKHLDFIINK